MRIPPQKETKQEWPLTSNKVNFGIKKIARDKEGHYMIKKD